MLLLQNLKQYTKQKSNKKSLDLLNELYKIISRNEQLILITNIFNILN